MRRFLSALSRLGPPAAIAGFGLLFFTELLLHPTQVLYSDYSDLLSLHLPAKRFLVRSWHQAGELPLWCPYNFAGMPFVHDVQSTVFYPLHWPLLLLPEEWVGAALSWLVVLHVIIAGWCMYAYAAGKGLGRASALVAAFGYMFAGKWLLHLLAGGHYNMVPLAWLPLVLLWLEQAIRRGSLFRATWAGAAFALVILGAYPYVTLHAGLFVGLWSLGAALERAGFLGGEGKRNRRRLSRALLQWAGLGIWTAVVAVALGAVQLLPSLEASLEASRGLGVASSRETLAGGLWSLVGLVGPPLTVNPDWIWENRVGLGLLWLAAAAMALVLRPRRCWFAGVVCLALLGFTLGGAAALQGFPGFRLFQLPSRILLLLAFPVSLLAGVTTQALFQPSASAPALGRRCRRVLLKVTGAVLLPLGVFAVLTARRGEELHFHPYWVSLLLTVPAAWWLLGQAGRAARCGWQVAWVTLLLADLWAVAWPLVEVRPEAEVYTASHCVGYLADHEEERGRVLDFPPPGQSANATPLWPGLSMVVGVEPVRGFNPVDVLRYKEYLQFLTNRDEPLRALDRMFTSAVLGSFPIHNQSLASLLGIRYLLQPAELPLEATIPDSEARKYWRKVPEAGDASPRTFNFIPTSATGRDAGVRSLPPYRVYENRDVLPRAFVVSEAAALADRRHTLEQLKATDFRRQVLLEGYDGRSEAPAAGKACYPATVLHYSPNCVVVRVQGDTDGYLVLTDLWFPGWTCRVDGQPARLYRANFLFRAVEVPAGLHQVVFRFAPASYRLGRAISGTTALAVFGFILGLLKPLLGGARAHRSGRGAARVPGTCHPPVPPGQGLLVSEPTASSG